MLRKRIKAAAIELVYLPNSNPRGFQKEALALLVTSYLFQNINWSILNLLNLLLGLGKYMQNMTLIFIFETYRALANSGKGWWVYYISAKDRWSAFILCRTLTVPYVVHGRLSKSELSQHFSWIDVDNKGVFFQVTGY